MSGGPSRTRRAVLVGMTTPDEPSQAYLAINRANWDERAPIHAASPDYHADRFAEDPAFLSDVVRFDVPLLGDVTGARGIHLQCHIGTDTISLSRLGAHMTGLDFSSASLAQARALAARAGVTFLEGDVYDAPALAGEGEFDLVFTGDRGAGGLAGMRYRKTVATTYCFVVPSRSWTCRRFRTRGRSNLTRCAVAPT